MRLGLLACVLFVSLTLPLFGSSHPARADVGQKVYLDRIAFNATLNETIDCQRHDLTQAEIDACNEVPRVALTPITDPLTGKAQGMIWFQAPDLPGVVEYPASCGDQCQQCGFDNSNCYVQNGSSEQHKTGGQVYTEGCNCMGPVANQHCDYDGHCFAECGGYGPSTVSCGISWGKTIHWDGNFGWDYSSPYEGDAPASGSIHLWFDAPSTFTLYQDFQDGVQKPCSEKDGDNSLTTGISNTFSSDPSCSSLGDGDYGRGYWGAYATGNAS